MPRLNVKNTAQRPKLYYHSVKLKYHSVTIIAETGLAIANVDTAKLIK
ncbi:hypothetical protein OLMES_3095 [Oleiphilus messinensis]|uniref:Uncharacterized protein n=1 Tax=Oleiphilus messinensis TaxID=141451 RepID=A0A1Y0I9E6_9GAMM|nr:hypothetical protein OLMES_3095 [Oleiphilus messinensis]